MNDLILLLYYNKRSLLSIILFNLLFIQVTFILIAIAKYNIVQ